MSYIDESDLMNREFLAERHNKLLNELKLLCNRLPVMYQQKISESFLSELANSLLDKTVFDIVKNLHDIQMMTENNLLERRMKLISDHNAAQLKIIDRHNEALANEHRVNPKNAETLKARQIAELESQEKDNKDELNHLDMKIIMELDQTVSDQQITLEKVGVPGFYVTNKPTDVKLQMYLLDFIRILSIKDRQK
ncbi:protein DGCR6 [Trichonephila clavata]|uniref:Protein DGCR6 n=1 Tax=Trichonephila clavata TaxID=2740835 RepID=A0A8X6FVW0_TRICU|nr:protein DGCR6 [Trichonephila clavata]